MKTVVCPKCNSVIVVPEGKDFALCCGEVIYIISNQDADIFFDELSNPSEPNEALKKAAVKHKKLK